MNIIKTAGIAYQYKNAKTGKFVSRNRVCAENELEAVIAQLKKDPNARNIRPVK